MNEENFISDKIINEINSELLKGHNWMAYNTVPNYLDAGDVYLFNSKDEALDFAENNISEFDNYRVEKVQSMEEVIKLLPYSEQLSQILLEKISTNQSQATSINEGDALHEQLETLGFGNKLNNAISFYKDYPRDRFHLPVRERSDKDAIDYCLFFEQKDQPGDYQLTKYEATLRIYPEIFHVTVNGIDVGKLDNAMKKFDWSIDHHTECMIEQKIQTQTGKQNLNVLNGIFQDVNHLHSIPQGKEIAEKLMFKYWSGGPYEPNQFSLDNLKNRYEFTSVITSDKMMDKVSTYKMQQLTAAQKLLNETNSFTQKTNFMNEKNFDYLKDQIKFTGFGEGLENELKDKMQKQTPEFQIAHKAKFGNDDLVAVLHFKKSDQTDMYFFNRYQVSLKPEQSSEAMDQTFYINKGNNITLKEAYNLMNGRAVNKDLTSKEGEVYNAWMQMDFKQTDNNGNYKTKHFHQNYGYDLDSVLAKHPIKELTNEQDKSRLVESLQKGNRQSVTFIQSGSEQKQFIEANPQFKTINIYDSNMHRLNHKQGQDAKQGQGEQNSAKQNAKNENQKQGDVDDGDAVPKASNKRKKKQSHSVS
jgi:hypothetical protein